MPLLAMLVSRFASNTYLHITNVAFYSFHAEFWRLEAKLDSEICEQEIDDRSTVSEMAQNNSPLKREHD